MPLSKPFTYKVLVKRFGEQHMAEKEASRRADEPTKEEIAQDQALAKDLIRSVWIPRDNLAARSDLIIALREARLECAVRKNMRQDPVTPVIGGVQPTRGEVRASLKAALRHMQKVREALPPGFSHGRRFRLRTAPSRLAS